MADLEGFVRGERRQEKETWTSNTATSPEKEIQIIHTIIALIF